MQRSEVAMGYVLLIDGVFVLRGTHYEIECYLHRYNMSKNDARVEIHELEQWLNEAA
jgi:hypothetical protein